MFPHQIHITVLVLIWHKDIHLLFFYKIVLKYSIQFLLTHFRPHSILWNCKQNANPINCPCLKMISTLFDSKIQTTQWNPFWVSEDNRRRTTKNDAHLTRTTLLKRPLLRTELSPHTIHKIFFKFFVAVNQTNTGSPSDSLESISACDEAAR